jgi:hypothetical protein
MNLFVIAFNKLLAEDISAGAGGAFGDATSMGHGGGFPGGGDFYAPGDARVSIYLGTKKKKKKKNIRIPRRKKRKIKRSKRTKWPAVIKKKGRKVSKKKKKKKKILKTSRSLPANLDLPVQVATRTPPELIWQNTSGPSGPSRKLNNW